MQPRSWTVGRWAIALGFAAAICIGCVLAWTSGFTIDDEYEQTTLAVNGRAVAAFLDGADEPFAELDAYQDRYYGVAFHAVSLPVRAPIALVMMRTRGLGFHDALVASEHVAVFLFFLVGLFACYRILLLARVQPWMAALGTLFILANPYVMGHATMNIKDAPFMTQWLICTWRLFVVGAALVDGQAVRRRDYAWLGVATGFLFAIRISAVLIGVEYVVGLGAILLLARPADLRPLARGIGLALAITLGIAWLAYPVLWTKPWAFFEAIHFMSKHTWDSCSLTWGTCQIAKQLPWTYVPGLLVVKVSVVGLAGLAVAILRTVRLRKAANTTAWIVLAVLAVTPLAIIAFLIATDVHLYNEIRQVLFLVPLIYLAAIVALAPYPRAFVMALGFGLGVATADHITLAPYEYVWFNEPARFLHLDRDFDIDYWALSSLDMVAMWRRSQVPPDYCLFVPYPQQFQPWWPKRGGRCLTNSFFLRDQTPVRPFFNVRIPRSELQGWGTQTGCRPVESITRRLALGREPMKLATLEVCE